jgi:hypothetical protein
MAADSRKKRDSRQRLGGDWGGGKAASSRRSPQMPRKKLQIRGRHPIKNIGARHSALPKTKPTAKAAEYRKGADTLRYTGKCRSYNGGHWESAPGFLGSFNTLQAMKTTRNVGLPDDGAAEDNSLSASSSNGGNYEIVRNGNNA